MPVANTTLNRSWPVPHETNTLSNDVFRLISALQAADVDVAALLASLAQKADATHSHTIADVAALQSALNGKASTGHSHAIGDLSNVDGSAAPGVNMGLIWSGTSWAPSAITAAMIASGIISQDRLPSHLTPAALAAAYATNAALAGKLALTGGTISGYTQINNQFRVARDGVQVSLANTPGQFTGYIYHSEDAYWGLVPMTGAHAVNWDKRLAYSIPRAKWAIGNEVSDQNDILTRADLPASQDEFDIVFNLPDTDAHNAAATEEIYGVFDASFNFRLLSVVHQQMSGDGTFTVRRNNADVGGLVNINPGATKVTSNPSGTTDIVVGQSLGILFGSNFLGDVGPTTIQLKCRKL